MKSYKITERPKARADKTDINLMIFQCGLEPVLSSGYKSILKPCLKNISPRNVGLDLIEVILKV